MKLENYKKSNIENTEVKSNILTDLVIDISYKGLLSFDNFIDDFNNYLNNKGFIGEKDLLSFKDINIINEVEKFENFIGEEPVARFTKDDNTTRVIVTRSFLYIYLDYEIKHRLKEYIEIFNNLVEIIKSKNENFVIFEKISLKKNNGVIVSTMNNILDCFDTRLFNNASLEINRIDKKAKTKLLITKSKNIFEWKDITFIVDKEIKNGKIIIRNKDGSTKRKPCYEIIFDVQGIIYLNQFEQKQNDFSIKVEQLVEDINSGIFEIFKLHISNSFLNDMVNGETKKILKGMHNNE